MPMLVRVENLKKYFPVRRAGFFSRTKMLRAVDGVSFVIKRGEILGLVGESGSGKSTLGRVILRLIEPTAGKVYFEGRNLFELNRSEMKRLRRKMRMIFQNAFDSLNPRKTIYQILSRPYKLHAEKGESDVKDAIIDVLELCGLSPPEDFIYRYPHELSAGQRQRVAIARAIAVYPTFIVADEPTSQLDVSVQAQILNLLRELKEKLSLSMLFITHDLAVVRSVANNVAVMYLGKIVELANVVELFTEPLHPYAKGLLSATPIPDPRKARSRKRFLLTGEVPSPIDLPTGCRFHSRCPYKMEKCENIEPKLIQVEKNHFIACHLFGDGSYTRA